MKLLTPQEFDYQLSNNLIKAFDVRENYECDIVSIECEKLPLGEVLQNLNKIPKNSPVVFFCKTGKRAEALIDLLETHYGYQNLHNLNGGIINYIETVKPQLPTY